MHSFIPDTQMYVALFPCNECAKMIIQSGIAEVVYCSDKHHHTMSMTASRRLLDMARVSRKRRIEVGLIWIYALMYILCFLC